MHCFVVKRIIKSNLKFSKKAHILHFKFPVWMLVVWLAAMQVLGPFVHGHLHEPFGADNEGLMHVHTSIPHSHQTDALTESIETPDHSSQIVTMAQGFRQKSEQLQFDHSALPALVFHWVPVQQHVTLLVIETLPRPFLSHYLVPQPQAPPRA